MSHVIDFLKWFVEVVYKVFFFFFFLNRQMKKTTRSGEVPD